MWDVIQHETRDSCVILTTHSMEECEALCGRVGIMVSGGLRCLGSVQHLKSKFGAGYQMEIKTFDDCKTIDLVKSFIESNFSSPVLEEGYGSKLKYHLPPQQLSLAAIFDKIETVRKSGMPIVEYSVSQNTLEQTFIKICKAQERVQEAQMHK